MDIGNIKNIQPMTDPAASYDPAAGPAVPPLSPPNSEPVAQAPQNTQPQEIAAKAEEQEPKKENLKDAVEKMNRTAVIFDRALKFQIHDKTKETMVAVVDMNTDKVIREIPSKEILDFISKMKDYLGMIFDKKA